MKIRNAEPGDFEFVHQLVQQVHTLHANSRPDIFYNVDPLTQQDYQSFIQNENVIALSAVSAGKVIGYACAELRHAPKDPILKPRIVAHLNVLSVSPDFQKHGAGKALLLAAEAEARRRGASSMELQVWAFNENAASFYRRLGMSTRSTMLEQKL